MAGYTSVHDSIILSESNYSRDEELRMLDESKAGVKGVVDSGITKVPNIFIVPKLYWDNDSTVTHSGQLQIPVIDLEGVQSKRRSEIVSEICSASKTWGMFQLINHGLPREIIHHMLQCIQEFNEQPKELKQEFYTSDRTKKMQYHVSRHPLYKTALWKDSISCHFENLSTEDLEALPTLCRKPMSDYVLSVSALKDILSELLSEALGVRRDYLKMIDCMKAKKLVGHYYPACPEPSLTIGMTKHSDPYFLTILVQNHINGLQVYYEKQWIDVNPKEGAIIVNIGDMLQILSNGTFRSAEHRVVASSKGPRLSVGCFFYPDDKNKDRVYGPIKELLNENDGPVYEVTSFDEYQKSFRTKGIRGFKALPELGK